MTDRLRFSIARRDNWYEPVVVRAYDGRRRVGSVSAERLHARNTQAQYVRSHAAGDAVAVVEREVGRPLHLFEVYGTGVVPELRGTGLGVELYVRLVDEIGVLDGVLVPSYATGSGSTSNEARRVYTSRRLAARAVVVDGGLAIYTALALPPGPRRST